MRTTTPAATTKPNRVTFEKKATGNQPDSRKRKDDMVGDIIYDLIKGKDPQDDDAVLTGVESKARTLLAAKTKVLAKQHGVNDLTNNPGKIPNNVFVKSKAALALPDEANADIKAFIDQLANLNATYNETARAIQLGIAKIEVTLLQKKLRDLLLTSCFELATGNVAFQASLLDVAETELGDMTKEYLAGATTYCALLSHTPNDPLWDYLHTTKEELAYETTRKFLFRNGHSVITGHCLSTMLNNTPIFYDADGNTILRFKEAVTPPTAPTPPNVTPTVATTNAPTANAPTANNTNEVVEMEDDDVTTIAVEEEPGDYHGDDEGDDDDDDGSERILTPTLPNNIQEGTPLDDEEAVAIDLLDPPQIQNRGTNPITPIGNRRANNPYRAGTNNGRNGRRHTPRNDVNNGIINNGGNGHNGNQPTNPPGNLNVNVNPPGNQNVNPPGNQNGDIGNQQGTPPNQNGAPQNQNDTVNNSNEAAPNPTENQDIDQTGNNQNNDGNQQENPPNDNHNEENSEAVEYVEVPPKLQTLIEEAAGQLHQFIAPMTHEVFNKVNRLKKLKTAKRKREAAMINAKTTAVAEAVEASINEAREKSVPHTQLQAVVDKSVKATLAKAERKLRKKSSGGGKATTTTPSFVHAKSGTKHPKSSQKSTKNTTKNQGHGKERGRNKERSKNKAPKSKRPQGKTKPKRKTKTSKHQRR